MKKTELTFTAILVPLDYLLVLFAAYSAYSLRFGWFESVRPAVFEIPLSEYMSIAAVVAAVFVLMFALSGLYAVSGPRRITQEISRMFFASSTAIMVVIAFIFLRAELFNSRFIVIAAWVLAFLYASGGRIIIRLIQRAYLQAGIGTHRIALIGGDDDVTSLLTRELAKNRSFGFSIIKRFNGFSEGTLAELSLLNKSEDLDEVIITDANLSRQDMVRVMNFCRAKHLTFRYSADLLAVKARNMDMVTIAGVPIVEIKGTRLDGWGRIYKRIFDIVGSLVLIVITSPIMLITAIAIKLDSKGPILFTKRDDGSRVTRVGEHGKPFNYYKFRSMATNTDSQRYNELADKNTRNDGPLVKIKDDPRITRVGSFIRKYSIDELPEFFLVLSGKISLVGPRPHFPEEVAKYEDRHLRVLTIKPGITGMAQVSGRAELSFEDEVKLDTFYVENWTPWLDIAILLKTPFVVVSRKGAS